jgi:hypothetical protein
MGLGRRKGHRNNREPDCAPQSVDYFALTSEFPEVVEAQTACRAAVLIQIKEAATSGLSTTGKPRYVRAEWAITN